jgi:hypothetical protein
MSIGTEKDSQKKMIGELLKAADRFIKSAEWTKALDEVGKALAIEPNNMYAMAYKDRINVSLEEEKKKVENEKVKKLAEEKKALEKPVEASAEEKKPEAPKPAEPVKSEEKKPEPPKAEPPKQEPPKPEMKPAAPSPQSKEESAARIESLRQEFTSTQAKLQREVAQLTMQVKEAQALKEATEKNLNAQIISLQQELASVKQQAGKSDPKESDALKKELDALKAKYQKDVDSAIEIAKAEMLTQVAVLQKELEAAKASGDGGSLQRHGELILKNMFHKAWQDGTISNDERALLLLLKGAIEMTEAKFGELEAASKSEAYINALRNVWSDGVVTPEESDFLTSLREKLGIPADEHFRLEGQIRKEVKK